jgi:hypothetical protein
VLPSSEDKERFLEFIRSGDDRATAAWRVNREYTGTMFRKMCNPASLPYYDPGFAKAYEEACNDRGPLNPRREAIRRRDFTPPSTKPNGVTKAAYLTEDQLTQFLEKIREGIPMETAAREIEPPTTITQVHRYANKDLAFSDQFRLAREEGYPAFKERLRSEAVRQAFAGDYRALRDQMIIHLEEARVLTTSRHEVGGVDGNAIRILAERHFHELPPEMLEALIATVEQRELGMQKALTAG